MYKKRHLFIVFSVLITSYLLAENNQISSPALNKLLEQINSLNAQILEQKYAVSSGYKKLISTLRNYKQVLQSAEEQLNSLYYAQCRANLNTQAKINELLIELYKKTKPLRAKFYTLTSTTLTPETETLVKKTVQQIKNIQNDFDNQIRALTQKIDQHTSGSVKKEIDKAREELADAQISSEAYEYAATMSSMLRKYPDPLETTLLTKEQKDAILQLEEKLIRLYSQALAIDPCLDFRTDKPNTEGIKSSYF